MLAAELEGVLGEELHGFGGAPAKRSDGGVVQVDEALSDWKLVAVLLPEPLHLIHAAHEPHCRPCQQQKYDGRRDTHRRHDAEKARQRH